MTSWQPWNWGSKAADKAGGSDSSSSPNKADFALQVGNQSWTFERDPTDPSLYQAYANGSYAGFVRAEYLHNKQEVARAIDGPRDRLPSFLSRQFLVAMLQQLNQQQRGG